MSPDDMEKVAKMVSSCLDALDPSQKTHYICVFATEDGEKGWKLGAIDSMGPNGQDAVAMILHKVADLKQQKAGNSTLIDTKDDKGRAN